MHALYALYPFTHLNSVILQLAMVLTHFSHPLSDWAGYPSYSDCCAYDNDDTAGYPCL